MLRMIIADDEPFVRETISRIINWSQYGIELIGCCNDGIETYNMILDEYPDLVLLDINMPGINGLDLIQQIHSIDDTISFIIISGYDNFEYAKRAMQYNVSQYLLKPCNRRQIIEAIEAVKKQREKQEFLLSLQTENILLKRRFHDTVQNQFLLEVFSGSPDSGALIRSYESLLAPEGGAFSILYVTYLEKQHAKILSDSLWPQLEAMRSQLLFRILYVNNTAILVFHATDSQEIERLKTQISAFRFPEQSTSPECILKHYLNFFAAMTHMISNLSRYNKIIQFSNDQPEREIYNLALSLQQIQVFFRNDICRLADSDQEERSQLLLQIFSDIKDLELAKVMAIRILYQLNHMESTLNEPQFPRLLEKISAAADETSLRECLSEQIDTLVQNRRKNREYKDFVNQIIEYVHTHLSDSNLSLKWIADNILFMNATYLSKQFSQATGWKFSAYLNDLRMKRAKELLTSYPDIKMSDIADEIGLGENPQYFSQLFKKYEGITPSQFYSEKHPS